MREPRRRFECELDHFVRALAALPRDKPNAARIARSEW